jgi:NADH-ubiquinone oxidoreductase chain 5
LGTLTAFLTAFYSTRLINLVYLTTPNAKKTSYLNIHSENSIVIIPLSILALFAIFLGFVASDMVGVGSDFLGNSLFYHPSHLLIIEAEFSLPLYVKLMPTALSLLGAGFAFYLYHYGHYLLTDLIRLSFIQGLCSDEEKKSIAAVQTPSPHTVGAVLKNGIYSKLQQASMQKGLNPHSIPSARDTLKATLIIRSYTFLNGKYLLDNLFNNSLISGGLKLGYIISKLLDKGLIELIGPFGLSEGSYSASYNLTKLDTGVITTYALYITLGLISILFILFSPFF